ncbi:A-kinase anchor protein 9-like isoform X3 [Eriocheir sinensis]|uniref:A-kinase anchor protein 9-like isoform X3 n=1 Tax=Eriocheir sinensis TaxID=95602 RepID=UPI0021C9A691|nr:A-kinase anchor protein 9-like isoform X3 [Eriocheir sinensis]
MAEEQNRASSHGHPSVDQLQQELHAKELLLEALRYENNSLRDHSDRHYDPTHSQDWKSYDTLKKKMVEYQTALEQRDHIIGQLEGGIKQLMQKNLESEAKGRKAEEHYSGEIQTLAQQVQELTAQLSLTSYQHQANMRAAQEHFNQQLAASKDHMRVTHERDLAAVREEHALKMQDMTLQMAALERCKNEESAKLTEQLTQHSSTLGAQLEEEREKVASLLREKEEWEVYKKELEAEVEEKETLRRCLDEETASRDDLQDRLRKQAERQMRNEERMHSLQKVTEGLSQDLKVEMERKKETEAKLQKEIQNARKLFEQKTAFEVKQEQVTLQLRAAEEELANVLASKEGDYRKLEALKQEVERLTKENAALSKARDVLIEEKNDLCSVKETSDREKESLSSEKRQLTKENLSLASKTESLTKRIEELTLQCRLTIKEKEILDSDYKMLKKEKEALTMETSRLVEAYKSLEREQDDLLKETEVLTKAKESLITERNGLLSEKRDSDREKDLLMRESEIWATEKEALLTEKDNLILENKSLVSEKVKLVEERDSLTMKIESLSSEKENLILENKSSVSENMKLVEERDSLTMKIESLSSEKENLILENKSSVSENMKLVEERDSLTMKIESLSSEKELILGDKKVLFEHMESLGAEKEKLMKEKDDLVGEKHSWAEERKALLQETDIWATDKEMLLTEKETLLTEKKSILAEKETLDEDKQNLSQQIRTLCIEREAWIQKEQELNKKNESLATRNESLAKESSSMADAKVLLLRENESLCQENKKLTQEKENLMTQLRILGAEQERLLERVGGLSNKAEHTDAGIENLLPRIGDLQREKAALAQCGTQVMMDSGETEVTEGQVEECAGVEATGWKLEKCTQTVELKEGQVEERAGVEAAGRKLEKFTQTVELKESDLRDLGDSYKEKYLLKERELQELDKTLKDKFSHKERELEEMHRKFSLEKDNELRELREEITCKESELQELRKKQKGMEELHGNCLSLLERLQSGEQERKRVEEECEDKCEVLNAVLRSVDVKLCEATALLSQQKTGAEPRKDRLQRSDTEDEEVERTTHREKLDYIDGRGDESGRREGVLKDKLTLLEKEKKELCNEAERLESKIHEQHFIITSLQNEKVRLGQHISHLEDERKSLRAAEASKSKDNLNTQEELIALRVKVKGQEEKLELQGREIRKFRQTLTEFIAGGGECPEKLRGILTELLSSNVGEPEIPLERVDVSLWLTMLCQDLEEHWRHQHAYLDCLATLQQHSDKLQQDKLQTDLENISFQAELDHLRQHKTRVDPGVEERLGAATDGGDDKALELVKVEQENRLLKECLASNNVLLRHEKLQKLCPRPKFERELKLRLVERRAVIQVVEEWVERFTAQWKVEAETHPSLARFTEALTSCVEELSTHLLGTHSDSSAMNIEVAASSLQQAVIKVVSGAYQETVIDTLKSLEQDLNQSLQHISQPPEVNPGQKHASNAPDQLPPQNTSPPHEERFSPPKDVSGDSHSFFQDLTARVEYLINVRTTLVDAANELDEELEDTIGQRVALLREQLQEMLCSREANTEHGPCLPVIPEHKAFIQEFTEFTAQVSQEAHSEKVEVLRSQQEMLHKILEDNQAKLGKVCQAFLGSVPELTNLEELEGKVRALVDSLEGTLAQEVVWVEQQYKDLLEQYIQEQDVNNQACTRTYSRLIDSLTHLLQAAEGGSREQMEDSSSDVCQLQQNHLDKIQHLETQLAAKDQEALQHLQGVYIERDWYKKTVGLLSHVTFQLLHYYRVAESLTGQPQQDPSSSPHPADISSPGKMVDLSFRSDCVGEEGEMLAFSDDGVLATGLMGRTAFISDGESEEPESALDSSVVSEGMLDDFDKDEQLRALLERSYPQLMAILRGRVDMVQVASLEKEVQELTISLQASAGMLKIFIHSVSSDRINSSTHTLKDEGQEESMQDSALETSHSQPSQENSDAKDVSLTSCDPLSAAQQATKDVRPPRPTLQGDLSTISEGLIQLLSQEEALASFTMLAPQDPQNKEQLRAVLCQLCEAAQATASLKLELHHTKGLQQGLEEERLTLQEEVARLTHYNKNLARELQVLKDRLEEAEGQENQKPISKYAAKWESKKDIRERASAALTAKNAIHLGHEQLEARVRELEVLLEEVVKESDTALEVLRARETDLTQQLEVADRQLKSARQFLEEHASERDQEVEELVAVRDKLTMQVREQEAQIALQGTRDKEVESLERQLREMCEELQEALCSREELQVEFKSAKDKIFDLREIIHSLESQADCRCMKEAELAKQVETLSEALARAQEEVQRLAGKVEELQQGGVKQAREPRTDKAAQSVSGEDGERERGLRRSTSLLSELQEDALSTSAMLQRIEKCLGNTTRGLEALQLSGSVEDISAQEVEVSVVGAEGRISPATVDRRLDNQLMALEHTTEAAIKRNKDLQLTIKNLQRENEEVSAERDTLQERSKEQLVKISRLEARLDEVRRADHPAVSELRQRLAMLQEDLEAKRAELTKKGREVEELKHSLSNLRAQLTSREGELQHLQTASTPQPTTLSLTAQGNICAPSSPQEDNLEQQTHTTETAKQEGTEVEQKSSLSPLAVDLIKEKNAEISELTNKLTVLVCAIQKVDSLLREGGSPALAQKMLFNALNGEVAEGLNETEEQEMLRDGAPEQSAIWTRNIEGAAATEVSPDLLHQASWEAEGSVHTRPLADSSLMSTRTVPTSELSQKTASPDSTGAVTVPWEVYEAMCCSALEVPVLRGHIKLLRQEIQSLTHYQTHLEEDFRSAQELLEAREAEILQLSDEVEDSPPVPLATSVHSPALELKVEQLQQALHEVHIGKADCEARLEQLSLKNKLYSEEIEQLEGTVEALRQEAQQSARELKEKEALLHALRQQVTDNTQQHEQQMEDVSSRLRGSKAEVIQLSSALQGKTDEVTRMTAQLERVHADLKERLTQSSREAAEMDEQFQQKISDLRDEHAAREKELCSYYEEHMAKQIRDLAERMSKDKVAAMARQQEVFEAALHKTSQERSQSRDDPEQPSASASPALPMLSHSHLADQQTAGQLCAAVDALTAGLKKELEKSGQLDQSVASLMKAGASGEATRASSALSDASEGEEPASINGRIQHLMNKIHSEGIEVLTLIDVLFLFKHHTKLDGSQHSLITSSSVLGNLPMETGEVGADQSRLLRNLAAVEEELAKREQEMKRQIGALEFQLEQEKLSGSEWKLSYESEKQHTRDLMEQLRKERLSGVEQVSELTLLRSHIFILRLQHQKVQEENCSLSENQKERNKQIESLQSALQAERNNFSCVSKVLSEERKAFALTHTQQENIIKDLRNTQEKERERFMALRTHFERLSTQHHTEPPATPTPTIPPTLRQMGTLSKSTSEDLKIQLAVERERCVELERACERERLRAMTQKEQATTERARARAEMRETECKLSELTRTVRSLETEKERLVRQMSHERDLIQHQDSHIKELEGEVKRLEADSKAQSDAHQAMTQKMREESSQLHLAYTRTLTKLGEIEAETCDLHHRLRGTAHELQVAREREEQLKQDLHTERTAVDQLGLSAFSRITNFDKCAEMQLKQNLELSKSVLRLTDDQRGMRTQIAELEDTITSLNQQLLSAQEVGAKTREALKMERLAWEREKAALQNFQNQFEAEAERMRAGRTMQRRTPSAAEMMQLYGHYLQSEHQRKALVWQKRYLLVVIKGYSDTEHHTRARLTAMAPLHLFPSTTAHRQARQSGGKFRVAGFVVVAMCRMRKLVQRFQKKIHHWEISFNAALSAASTPDSSRPQSCNSVAGGREACPLLPPVCIEMSQSHYTGLTPPTRGPTNTTPRPLSASRRSLFQEDSDQLNQYVERLDNIHSVLGLTHRKQ